MIKAMEGEPYKRPYRIVMGILIVSINFCAMLPYIAPSILMGDIMQTYGADLGLAGLGMTAQLVMAGVSFFIGSFIVDKIGMLKTSQLAITMLLAGVLLSALAPNIYIFIIARVIAGFGQGLAVGLMSFMNTWFKGKELSLMITFNSMSSAISIALSVALCRPIATAFGSWKGVMWVYAAVTALFTVLWYVLGKNSPEGEAQEKERAAQGISGQKRTSLSMAIKQVQFWKVLVYAGLFTVINTSYATFMPTYLTTVKMVPESLAVTAASLNSLVGLCGSLLGGIIVTKIWRRKTMMLIASALYFLCGMGITILNSDLACVVLGVMLGFLFYLPLTSQSTLVLETCTSQGKPEMIPGAMALCGGTGMLLTVLVSPLFQLIVKSAGMTTAYRVFFGTIIIAFFAVLLMKETGKKPETQTAATKAGE